MSHRITTEIQLDTKTKIVLSGVRSGTRISAEITQDLGKRSDGVTEYSATPVSLTYEARESLIHALKAFN